MNRFQIKTKRISWRPLFLVMTLLGVMTVTGCQKQPQPEPTAAETVTVPTVTVRFLAYGEVISQQEIKAGTCPQAVETELPGGRIAAWQDAQGQMVNPQDCPVEADTDYSAVVYPELSNHEAYLFPDDNGFIRPDDPLMAEDLASALRILAAEGAARYFPGLPAGQVELTASQLRGVLDHFFPQEALDAAFSIVEGEVVTRGDFSRILNPLLGRGGTETVTVNSETAMLVDLAMDRADFTDLLEASLPHVQDSEGQSWEDAVWELKRETGFFNLGGWLYYADETGCMVRDAQVGDLTFGADGRYTSGDEELDAMVAEILNDIILENPDLERLELLRKAFEYSRDSFTYLRKNPMAFGATGWEIEYAKTMLTGGLGNCYNYASVFWALARGLGYEAKAISGTMTLTDQPHSWVEIEMDGIPYIFDPEEEMVYRTQRNIFDRDMFMVTYAAGTYWNYKRAS